MLEASPKGQFAKGKVDPHEAGRRGAEERERRRRHRLDGTREALERPAFDVAERLAAIGLGREKASPQEVTALRDVLDRVIGRAPERLEVTEASQHLMQLIEELDGEERATA